MTKPAKFPSLKKNNIPPCTLKFFPSNILHCVLWSMNHCKKFFDENIKFVKYIEDFYDRMKQKNLESRIIYRKIKKYFKLFKIANEKNFDKCIKFSANKFIKLFIYNINNSLRNYHPNKINKITGKNFWIGYKRLPHPLTLNIENEICFEFIKNFSCLLANCLDIDISNIIIDEKIKDYCKNLEIKEFSPKIYEITEFYNKKIDEEKKKINDYLLSKKN